MKILGLENDPIFLDQHDESNWPLLKQKLSEILSQKSRDDWMKLFEGLDTCVFPVEEQDPSPNATPFNLLSSPPQNNNDRSINDGIYTLDSGRDSLQVLSQNGFTKSEIDQLQLDQVVFATTTGEGTNDLKSKL